MTELNNCKREFTNGYTYLRARLHLQNQISELKLKQFEAAKAKAEQDPKRKESNTGLVSKIVGKVKH